MSKEEKSQCNDCFDGDHCKGKVAGCECCPEKKDVWGEFEKLFENENVVKLQVGIFKSDVQINTDALKSFIKTHFIPRAEVVEDITEKYTKQMAENHAFLIDKNFWLVVKQKPKWMPSFLYRAVIKNLIQFQQTK